MNSGWNHFIQTKDVSFRVEKSNQRAILRQHSLPNIIPLSPLRSTPARTLVISFYMCHSWHISRHSRGSPGLLFSSNPSRTTEPLLINLRPLLLMPNAVIQFFFCCCSLKNGGGTAENASWGWAMINDSWRKKNAFRFMTELIWFLAALGRKLNWDMKAKDGWWRGWDRPQERGN